MKRLAIISAWVVTLLAGAMTGAVTIAGAEAQAAPAVSAQPAPAPTQSRVPRPAPDADTKRMCELTGKTVYEGIETFNAELDKAGTAAGGGDLPGAEGHVKQSGAVLTDLAGKLRTESEPARNQEFKSAVGDVVKELETLGGSLKGLAAMKDFDTTRLQELSERVAEICGER